MHLTLYSLEINRRGGGDGHLLWWQHHSQQVNSTPTGTNRIMTLRDCSVRGVTLQDMRDGIAAAATRLRHLIPPDQFAQLVAAQEGSRRQLLETEGPGSSSSSSVKRFRAWKRRCCEAVNTVCRAVLQGRVSHGIGGARVSATSHVAPGLYRVRSAAIPSATDNCINKANF